MELNDDLHNPIYLVVEDTQNENYGRPLFYTKDKQKAQDYVDEQNRLREKYLEFNQKLSKEITNQRLYKHIDYSCIEAYPNLDEIHPDHHESTKNEWIQRRREYASKCIIESNEKKEKVKQDILVKMGLSEEPQYNTGAYMLEVKNIEEFLKLTQ